MASIRRLKKEINDLVFYIIEDSFVLMEVFPESDLEKAFTVVEDVLELRNNLIARTNHVDGKDNPKLVKKHFESIISEMNKGCDDAYHKLEEIIEEQVKPV